LCYFSSPYLSEENRTKLFGALPSKPSAANVDIQDCSQKPDMPQDREHTTSFNIMIVGQSGRLEHEALLFAASLRQSTPDFAGSLYVANPQPGPLWDHDPRMSQPIKDALIALGATITPFTCVHFGQSYPHGNKIEALAVLPAGKPFVFFDTDTLISGDLSKVAFDFSRPSASMNRTATWPMIELYWPGYTAI
jgi:hypothetical protein